MPDQETLDTQFEISELRREVDELKKKLNQFDEAGADRYREFGEMPFGRSFTIGPYGTVMRRWPGQYSFESVLAEYGPTVPVGNEDMDADNSGDIDILDLSAAAGNYPPDGSGLMWVDRDASMAPVPKPAGPPSTQAWVYGLAANVPNGNMTSAAQMSIGATSEADPARITMHSSHHTTDGDQSQIFLDGGILLPYSELTQITADQNDYEVGADTQSVVVISSDAARNITGIVAPRAWAEATTGGDYQGLLYVINRGSFDITLVNASGSSALANRFVFDDDIVLKPSQGVLLMKASDANGWYAIAVATSAGGGGGVATDVIWDAKGDLAVGTGADTASKLAYPATNGRHIYSYTSAATGLTWDNFFGTSTSSNGSGSAPVLDGAHRMIYTESLSGARTIPVRAASTLGDGDMVSLKNFSADTQTLTVNVNGGGTIDGQTTLNLGYKEGVILAAGNNKWFVMSREQPTYWIHLTADYTLTSSTSAQKIFNTTTNGQVALPPGVYEFECFLYLTTMSATSGNARFTLGGTATIDRVGFHVTGIDNSSPLNAGTRTGSASVTTASVASMVTAGTGTGMTSLIEGIFRVSAGGTLIPQISLVTAAAAVVKAGSWFKCRRIGESAQTYNGAWT